MPSKTLLRSCGRIVASRRVRAVLSLGVLLGFGTVGTMAYWTDSATVTGGTFHTGTLDIQLSGAQNEPASFTTGFAMANMQPGDSKSASIVVQNKGTVPFVYTVSGAATAPANDLSAYLKFKIVPAGVLAGNACTGTATYDGLLSATSTPVVTTPRVTAAGASETFCVTATLPSGTILGQDSSTSAQFTFNAKQVGAP